MKFMLLTEGRYELKIVFSQISITTVSDEKLFRAVIKLAVLSLFSV